MGRASVFPNPESGVELLTPDTRKLANRTRGETGQEINRHSSGNVAHDREI